MAQKYASWAAKDTREANSLPSDFDAEIVGFQFSKEAPDNYPAEGNPIFGWVTYLIDAAGDYADKSEEERTLKQAYNLGGKAGDEFTISDDGFGLIPNEDAVASIRKGSKFDLWKCALENNGVSQAITESGNGSKVIGIRGHYLRVADEKLLGKKREFANDKREKKFTAETLVMVKLLAMPGEKDKATSTAKTAPAATSAPASSGEDLDGRTLNFLIDVLNAKDDKTVQRSQLIGLLSKQAIKEKDRQDIARRGSDEAFLLAQAETGLIVYNQSAKPQTVQLAA